MCSRIRVGNEGTLALQVKKEWSGVTSYVHDSLIEAIIIGKRLRREKEVGE